VPPDVEMVKSGTIHRTEPSSCLSVDGRSALVVCVDDRAEAHAISYLELAGDNVSMTSCEVLVRASAIALLPVMQAGPAA
jgi:hypothetical protein